jgi:hypothetical protein
MGDLKPTLDTGTPEDIAIAVAVAVLADSAQNNLARVTSQLEAAGFKLAGFAPPKGNPQMAAPGNIDIGAMIEGRGVYHGAWSPRPNGVIVHAYSDTDFLRDVSGQQMLLTWYAARDELARRNGGRRYGDGTEAALSAALAKSPGTEGAYKDGDLVMGPQVFLNGVDRKGSKVRAENTYDLLSGPKNEAFKNISQTLKDASSDNGRWSWSCSEAPANSSLMRAVRLSDGYGGWIYKGSLRLGVLPFRFFREPHAVKAVSHLNI